MAAAMMQSVEKREFALRNSDFEIIAAAIYDHAGIVIGAQKRELVYSRLARRLRRLDLPDFAAYVDRLQGPAGAGELAFLINALTTNHTHFFRENHHFDFIRDIAVPHWVERAEDSGSRKLRIWSAGCSTGEEPYSIALTLAAALEGRAGWDWKVLATDIDTEVLATAKAAAYGADRKADFPPALASRFLQPDPAGGETFRIAPEVRSRVVFNRLNLHAAWPMRCKFDLIFCRNVAIYFDAEAKERLVHRFVHALKPAAWLCLGHSETALGEQTGLRNIGRTIYARAPEPAR